MCDNVLGKSLEGHLTVQGEVLGEKTGGGKVFARVCLGWLKGMGANRKQIKRLASKKNLQKRGEDNRGSNVFVFFGTKNIQLK